MQDFPTKSRSNFLTTRFGWKILHLQFAICFNRSNYIYTNTITTSGFLNVFFKILDFMLHN